MDRRYWIGLNLVKGIGPVKFRRLIDHFGDPQTAWQARLADLAAAGLDRRAIENLEQVRRGEQLDAALRAIDLAGAQVLTWMTKATRAICATSHSRRRYCLCAAA